MRYTIWEGSNGRFATAQVDGIHATVWQDGAVQIAEWYKLEAADREKAERAIRQTLKRATTEKRRHPRAAARESAIARLSPQA